MRVPDERDKQSWRAAILARRAELPEPVRRAEATALAAAVQQLDRTEWVCGYIPLSDEPGSVAMLDALRTAGSRVLVPVTGTPGPLRWAEYTGMDTLRPARFGLLEPSGQSLGPEALSRAGLILVPALGVDQRGVRLGRGAGYYDRTLGAVTPDTRLVVVVRDEEIVPWLPEEQHDIRMHWALTPDAGLRRLDRTD